MNFFFGKRKGGQADYLLIAAVLMLTAFGLVALASASSDLGKIKFNDTYYYLKHQAIYGLAPGIIGFIAAYFFSYKRYKKIALILLLLNVALLGMVLFTQYGHRSGGSTRWLEIGPVILQPSELLKITFILYLAAWLSRPGSSRQTNFKKGLLPFLVFSGAIGYLLIREPATSTVAILLFSALIVYFLSGARVTYIFAVLLAGALALTLLVYVSPYRFERFSTYLNPDADVKGSGYHLNQARITIGSGGLMGVGYGQSANKYNYLPESVGDSIFAIIAEELGFVGATGLIFAFFVLILRGFLGARNVRDEFGKLVMVGFTCVIGIQAFVNIGAISGLVPLTGMPLPFISYGGTSLVVFLTMGGIMVNISKYS